jgi:hypothetical protein
MAAVRLLAPGPLCGEQLPFRHFGVAEERAGGTVHAIYQDHHGYLWFAGEAVRRRPRPSTRVAPSGSAVAALRPTAVIGVAPQP